MAESKVHNKGGLELKLQFRTALDDVAQQKPEKVGTFQRFRTETATSKPGDDSWRDVGKTVDRRATLGSLFPLSSLLQRDPYVYAARPWSATKRPVDVQGTRG
jgi:hypothetical protein